MDQLDNSQSKITQCIDALLKTSGDFETKLSTEGMQQAHEWIFAIREVLYDLRRVHLLLENMYSDPDISQTPQKLKEFAQTMLYEVIPHVQGHMSELEEAVIVLAPDPEIPDETEDSSSTSDS